MTATALVLGSSPRAPASLIAATDAYDVGPIITTNSGIKLVPVPAAYVSIDQCANRAYADLALEAQKNGTKLVTLKRLPKALESRGITHFDEFIEEGRGEPTRDGWGSFRYSGPFCLEYALRMGLERVILCGMCGWRFAFDYFDAEDHPVSHTKTRDNRWQLTMTRQHVQPRTRRLVELWPEVEFVVYGRPSYDVDAPNWRIIEYD